jgi:hypothetical protein
LNVTASKREPSFAISPTTVRAVLRALQITALNSDILLGAIFKNVAYCKMIIGLVADRHLRRCTDW